MKELQELLLEVQKETGISIIMVSHDLNEVQKMADRIWFIEKGSFYKNEEVRESNNKAKIIAIDKENAKMDLKMNGQEITMDLPSIEADELRVGQEISITFDSNK